MGGWDLLTRKRAHAPNTSVGWISTIRVLGDVFKLKGFYVWHLAMAVLMCAVWLVLFSLTLWAFAKGKIFMAKPEEVIHDSLERKGLFSPPTSARSSFQADPHAHAHAPAHAYNKEAHNHV